MVHIYGIKFKGRVIYVGNSFSAQDRWAEHLSKARAGRFDQCPSLYQHMRENNYAGYTFEVLEVVEDRDRYEKEKEWIARLNTRDDGCNRTRGGISASGPDHYMWGKKAHPQAIAASVAFRKGKPMPQEWKDAIGRGNKGKKTKGFAVVCTTTGDKFPSLNAAAKHYGVTMFVIQQIFHGRSDKTKRKKLKGLDFEFPSE